MREGDLAIPDAEGSGGGGALASSGGARSGRDRQWRWSRGRQMVAGGSDLVKGLVEAEGVGRKGPGR